MRAELTEAVDYALNRLAAGEAPQDILAAYPHQAPALKPLLEAAQALEALHPVPMPPPQVLQARRRAFLADVEEMRRLHRTRWPAPLGWLTASWERLMQVFGLAGRPFARLAVTLMLAFGLVCILSSAGLVAAQHSLPGSPLYPLKLLSEEIGLSLTSDVTRKADMYLRLALERAQEITRLAETGQAIDPATVERMKARLQQALQLAARLDDAQLNSWLAEARQNLFNQASSLQQAQLGTTGSMRALLEQAATQLKQAGEQVEAGQQDPQRFRQQRGVDVPAESTPRPVTPAIPSPPPKQSTPAREPRAEPSPTVPATYPAPDATPSPEPIGGTAPAGPHPENRLPSEESEAAQPSEQFRSGGVNDDGGAGKRDDDRDIGHQSEPGSGEAAGKQETRSDGDGGGNHKGR